jgi:aerotaxis receptor
VAQEVKNLANQTARSTDEITRQIAEIQAATGTAVAAVKEISGTIIEIDHISGTIAAAMEQQSAATQEISRNVIETSKAAQEVSSRIAMVSQEADQIGSQAAHVRQGSSEIASSIEELRHVLVRVVRTTTTDADRRRKPRFHMDESCTVMIGGVSQAARVINLSTGGATLSLTAGLGGESNGILCVDQHHIRIAFVVRNVEGDAVRVKFDEADPAMATVRALVERLSTDHQPLDTAA